VRVLFYASAVIGMHRVVQIGLVSGLIYLGATLAVPAADPIVGSGSDDTIIGTEQDDEIRGEDGDDLIQGRAGNDVLIGGRGTDILFGGPGSDQFVIDFISDLPDEIEDFRPEEGDTLLLRFAYNPQEEFPKKRPTIRNVEIDYDGDVTMSLINEEQFDVVRLKRSDLMLRVDDLGGEVRLIFTKKIGKQ
jgi:hypothetical protein